MEITPTKTILNIVREINGHETIIKEALPLLHKSMSYIMCTDPYLSLENYFYSRLSRISKIFRDFL